MVMMVAIENSAVTTAAVWTSSNRDPNANRADVRGAASGVASTQVQRAQSIALTAQEQVRPQEDERATSNAFLEPPLIVILQQRVASGEARARRARKRRAARFQSDLGRRGHESTPNKDTGSVCEGPAGEVGKRSNEQTI